MRYLQLASFLTVLFQSFSQIVYHVPSAEKTYNFTTKSNFTFLYPEESIFLRNAFDVSIKNFSSSSLIKNFCDADDLLIHLAEMGNVVGSSDESFSNPEVIYVKPYFFYIDDLMEKLYYKKIEFDASNGRFIEKSTNYFNIMTPAIPKNSLIRFFHKRNQTKIIVFINNYVYKIILDDETPKLSDDVYQIEGIKLPDISDLIVFEKGFLFLNGNTNILYYLHNETANEAILAQSVESSFLNLSTILNITSISYNEETKILAFSDYLNGVYFLKLDESNFFSFMQRINDGKVLQLNYQDSSLIFIKEIFKNDISSIILQEYLENDEEFTFNREVYLSSSANFNGLARTSDYVAILEPNLIHIYRTSLNSEQVKLETNEFYREFRAENYLQILTLSSHNNNDEELFFLGVKRDSINLFYPQVKPLSFNCFVENNHDLKENMKYSIAFDVELKYLNCPEKKKASDHNLENYCSKHVHIDLSLINTKYAAFLQVTNSNKVMQWTMAIAIGMCVGVVLGVVVGIILKKKYNSLKFAYKMLETQFNQAEIISGHNIKFVQEEKKQNK